ncbi:hypothetical protein JMF94_14820 [Desulfovibrio sp. UIB00]|uniref:hypothetical protein n=1 Tax=Desulfovibrio sp. UIB00 TaxID=2804314 RepID=UPI001F1014E3|nr:hypothetical protein [Desulfovibrio sp. UIB00]MCH5146354.1 hypothetical protein [Desulfovibrio sp. UIB00]
MTKHKPTHLESAEQAPTTEAPNDWRASAQRIEALRASLPKSEPEPEQATLPGVTVPRTPGDTAPMNNDLARTPLFAPIKRGRRKMLDKAPLPGPAGNRAACVSGKQLDMADQDVFLCGLKQAAEVGPDQPVTVLLGEFLTSLGWNSRSDAAYRWLKGSFERLATCRLFFETEERMLSLPLLGPLEFDKREKTWTFTIPEKTMALFLGQSYGFVDLAKRRALGKRVDLAKWVQSYAASHAPGQHSVSLENLHKWSGYEGRMRDFRTSLAEALDELRRVGVLTSWEFAERKKIVCWYR